MCTTKLENVQNDISEHDNCFKFLKTYEGHFPGGSVVRTPCFQCGEHRLNPWSGN